MPSRPGIGMNSQDWDPVVISKRPTRAADTKDEKAVNAARRSGAAVETMKKATGGVNHKATSSSTSLGLSARKLEEETDELAHKKVAPEVKVAIQKARLEKKMTQAQLGQMINEKPSVIQEYESGKAIPNQQVLSKLERALDVKLRGKLK